MLAGQCQGREERAWPAQDRPVRLDAAWLCKLAGRGMLRPSFVPSPWQRDLCCYRRVLIQERTREKQRAGKLPEDAQLTELPDRIVVSGGLASGRAARFPARDRRKGWRAGSVVAEGTALRSG